MPPRAPLVPLLALLSAAACMTSAWGQAGAMKLVTPRCADVGDEIVVELRIESGAPECVGMQAALSYDGSVLSFISEEPGDAPFDLPIYFAHSVKQRKIDIAVGITPPNAPSFGGVVAKRLRFLVTGEPTTCIVGGLVSFRRDLIVRNLLTNSEGDAIVPPLVALNAMNLGDPPTLVVPPDVVVTPPVGTASASTSLGVLSASGCGPTVNLTFVRSDGKTQINAPFAVIDSPISVVWTATDECGRATSDTQLVTVVGSVGDLDGSGTVDGSDLAYVLSNFGLASAAGDANDDGIVDGADIAFLLNAWGS
jgi:hypothetical protein